MAGSSSRSRSNHASDGPEALGTTSLENAQKALTADRDALGSVKCEQLPRAVDKVLKVIDSSQKRKVPKNDQEPLAKVTLKLHHDILEPVSQVSRNNENVTFAPGLKQRMDTLSSSVQQIADGTYLSRNVFLHRHRTATTIKEVKEVSEKLDDVVEEFGNNDAMTASMVKHGKKGMVLLQDKAQEPVVQSVESEPGRGQVDVIPDPEDVPDKFRILLVGKSGVGKSTLVNKIFGVDLAAVSHDVAGRCDINREITAPENDRFILHDSEGYEYGDVEKSNTVKDFIRRRNMMPAKQDKIHTVWLCLEIPFANGRVLEKGDEEFLRADFGLPVVIVFTKYDRLVGAQELPVFRSYGQDGLTEDELERIGKQKAEEIYQKQCVDLIERTFVKNKRSVPYVRVARNDEESLKELAAKTSEHALAKLGEDVWLNWAIAQRANAALNVEASIAIGRKNYWRSLKKGFIFEGTVADCLGKIHDDIVNAWNLRGDHLLKNAGMHKKFLTILEDFCEGASQRKFPLKQAMDTATFVSGLVVSVAASGPAAAIAGPVAISVALAAWIYQGYKQAPDTVKLLMGYIVDLTIIMRALFAVTKDDGLKSFRKLKRNVINLVIEAYNDSDERYTCHSMIGNFVDNNWTLFELDQDNRVVDKIAEMMEDTDCQWHLSAECKKNISDIYSADSAS